ncbi:MAG TPA: PLP-dependent transferase, partial [Acidimicrobiales bacterium]|nr:PLP-dependent transferase [Acidimicrobiales bacterium]
MSNDPTAEPTEPGTGLHPDTVAIRSGRVGDATSLAPVLWPTSTFVSPSVDDARRFATTVGADRFYSRYGNPTVSGFEDAIAQLEGAEAARAYGSGMGAV